MTKKELRIRLEDGELMIVCITIVILARTKTNAETKK